MNELLEMHETIKRIHAKYEAYFGWKKVKNYDNYSVHKKGKVRNDNTGSILDGSFDSGGYKRVILRKHGKNQSHSIHKLVALAFVENPLKKDFVDHMDGNRTNNDESNLRWATRSENNANKSMQNNNSSGTVGVYRFANKWRVQISFEGNRKHLGYFKDFEEAKQIRIEAEIKYFGEFRKV